MVDELGWLRVRQGDSSRIRVSQGNSGCVNMILGDSRALYGDLG